MSVSGINLFAMVFIGRLVFAVLFLGILAFVIVKVVKNFSAIKSDLKFENIPFENIPMGSNQDFAFQQMHDNAHRMAMDMHNTAMHEHMSAHQTAMNMHDLASHSHFDTHQNFMDMHHF